MPHAISPRDIQEEMDDILIEQALDPENGLDFNRELEPGEKAEDAIDFGDLSDNDLADDEGEGPNKKLLAGNVSLAVSSLEEVKNSILDQEDPELIGRECSEGDGFDDLFGDNASSHIEDGEEARRQPLLTQLTSIENAVKYHEDPPSQERTRLLNEPPPPHAQTVECPNRAVFQYATSNVKDKAISKEQQLQQELFAMSRSGVSGGEYLPPPPENQEELLKSLWPKFERLTVPRFMELLPPKKIIYSRKNPPKKPKSLQPTKVNLDLAKDLEKSFKLPLNSVRRKYEDLDQPHLIVVSDIAPIRENKDDPQDIDTEPESEIIKGVTRQDLQILCQEWDCDLRDSFDVTKTCTDWDPDDMDRWRYHGKRSKEQLGVHVSKVSPKKATNTTVLIAP